ncbi:MAG TPA: cyclic peptide export ABC transporter [Pyrinomonadaceae bacterium]|nr:cyclic peptide export ABC transporter [Pyrinomonadaceae bacterium]
MKNLFQLIFVIAKWSKAIPRSRTTILLAIVSSFLAGVGYTILIALTKKILSESLFLQTQLISKFFALCILIPICGYVSQILLLHLTSRAAYQLRLQLSRQILAAPLRKLETLGPHRLLATLTQDIGSVIDLVGVLPLMLTQFAMMAGCLFYLGWLSWKLLLIMLGYLFLGLLTHQLPLLKAFGYFKLLREQWDAMYKAFHGLVVGTKELKLNRKRRDAFFDQQLEPASAAIQSYGIKGNAIAMAVSNWGQILFFIFIGLLLFATPHLINVSQQVFIGYTLAVLFMISPLTMVLNQIPALERAFLAAQRIEELGVTLEATVAETLSRASVQHTPWRRIELVNVTHTYRQENSSEEFQLGPINLTFEPGELIFLIGGNGSGKTTLIKLLMGLYEPQSGEIRVDERPITRDTLDEYRQRFSAVFYDFYLFERLFGLEANDLDAESRKYLDLLQLSNKLQIKDGKLSTIDLSQGQRKRLALLNAYLEDRPIYVFDEWAADQDPQFKNIFYYELVPELKARGKTVLVISHDDRYFEVADRLIKLESGKLDYDKNVSERFAVVNRIL